MNLYEINARIRSILVSADEDGCLSDEAVAELDRLDIDQAAKVEGSLAFRQGLLAEVAGYRVEIERLIEMMTTRINRAERIRIYVRDALLSRGINEIKTLLFNVRLIANPLSVDFVDGFDINTLPAEHLIFKEPQPNKKAILSDFKRGKPIAEGVIVASSGYSVRINDKPKCEDTDAEH